jgi:hypothetical protein
MCVDKEEDVLTLVLTFSSHAQKNGTARAEDAEGGEERGVDNMGHL